jgi:hypothetical protein
MASYRYKGDVNGNNPTPPLTWEIGKYYLLTKWERPEGMIVGLHYRSKERECLT